MLVTCLPDVAKDVGANRILKTRHRFSVGAWTWVGTFGSPGA